MKYDDLPKSIDLLKVEHFEAAPMQLEAAEAEDPNRGRLYFFDFPVDDGRAALLSYLGYPDDINSIMFMSYRQAGVMTISPDELWVSHSPGTKTIRVQATMENVQRFVKTYNSIFQGQLNTKRQELIVGHEFPVLDHGFVRLVDVMGGDARIVQSARVSYGAGTKSVREDAGLIDYLLRNLHTSPFEQVVFTFHIKCPIVVARQWVRHRTARMNEISGRYSVMKDECYMPKPENIQFQSGSNRQGRAGVVPKELAEEFLDRLHQLYGEIRTVYDYFIDQGISRELCRIVLPLSLYTEFYWQMDLNNLMRFLFLRLDSHAQWEIRQYAEVISEIVRVMCPLAHESMMRHVIECVKLSREEKAALAVFLESMTEDEGFYTGVEHKSTLGLALSKISEDLL